MLDHVWRSFVELRRSLKKRQSQRTNNRKRSARQATPRLELLEDRCLLATAVAIATNPISHTVVAGQTATFTAAATGIPAPAVQWEMSPAGSNTFTPLSDGSPFGGVTTDTLTVTGVTTALSGARFEAVFANATTTPATLTVLPAPSIGQLTQTGWTKSHAGFNGAMPISGGIGPFSIVSATGLPTGLTALISGNSIRFSGTPTVAQAFPSGSITIQDAAGDKASQTFTITIHPAPTISHMSNNNWTQGLADFTGAMTISGGTGPFTVVSQSNLPPGTTAVIHGDSIAFTGTPSVAHDFGNCSVTIEDAAGAFATKDFVIDVDPAIILGNVTLTQWTVGEPGFPSTITIGGGTGPYALAASSGLPTGLSAAVNGRTVVFTGTPTAIGTFAKGSVTVADADGATLTQTFSITINPAPTLSTLSDLAWTGGNGGFTGTVTISGGTAPYVIASYGGLAFNPAISGNTVYFTGAPPSQSLYNGTLTVEDKSGAEVTETIPNFRVNIVPTVSPLTTSQWTVGLPGFNGIMGINNGTAPFTIDDFRGLPTGLKPIVSDDTISLVGTPTAAQTFNSGAITLQDSGGATITIPISITINPALTITTASLPALAAGVAYGTTLKSTGGTGSNAFTVTSGSLPLGLTLSSHGTISGVSTATASYTFTITDADVIGDQTSEKFTIAGDATFAVGNLTQTQWTIGEPNFPGVMAITGGMGPYSITHVTGLPPGLTAALNGATVAFTGAPTAAGAFAKASITIADSGGVSVTEPFAITINPGPTLGNLSATAWTSGAPGFTGTIAINGGTGPYTIVNFKGLPFTPVVSGNTILLTGSAGEGFYANGAITLIDKAGAETIAKVASITINPQATITHMTVNNWTAGLPNFPGAMAIVGGTAPFTIDEVKNIPPGLTPIIRGDTIQFTGTPTAVGTFGDCTITLRDAADVLQTKTFVIALAPPLLITNFNLPAWRSGASYSATLNTTGGIGAAVFTVTSGALPPGLKLKSNGKISGIATAIGTFTFTVTATDVVGDKFSETFTL
jgi:large repetitive protein